MIGKLIINSQSSPPLDEFDKLLNCSLEEEASDIHIHVGEDVAEIYFRIYGSIYQKAVIPADYASRMISASFNKMSVSGATDATFNPTSMQQSILRANPCSLRVQTVQNYPNGYSVFYRIIHRSLKYFSSGVDSLGYTPEIAEALKYAVQLNNGLMAFSGTANAGKSTALQACIHEIMLVNDTNNILTIESPPEREIKGVTQIPIHESSKMSDEEIDAHYNTVFKSLLRVDAQVIVPTEIRNAMTLGVLEKAVTTGSKVISTIHSMGVVNTISRMINMGLHQRNISAPGFITLLVHQKLLPKSCPHCALKVDEATSEYDFDLKFIEQALKAGANNNTDGIRIAKKDGCEHCKGIGFNGRLLVAEYMRPQEEILESIYHHGSDQLMEVWKGLGYKTIQQNAIDNMFKGEVSPSVVMANFQ